MKSTEPDKLVTDTLRLRKYLMSAHPEEMINSFLILSRGILNRDLLPENEGDREAFYAISDSFIYCLNFLEENNVLKIIKKSEDI